MSVLNKYYIEKINIWTTTKQNKKTTTTVKVHKINIKSTFGKTK